LIHVKEHYRQNTNKSHQECTTTLYTDYNLQTVVLG